MDTWFVSRINRTTSSSPIATPTTTPENFRMQLEELMRKNGKIDENRIAIRDFWYYGQIQPKNPIADASETLH